MMQMAGSFTEFEHAMLRERQMMCWLQHARMVGLVDAAKN